MVRSGFCSHSQREDDVSNEKFFGVILGVFVFSYGYPRTSRASVLYGNWLKNNTFWNIVGEHRGVIPCFHVPYTPSSSSTFEKQKK